MYVCVVSVPYDIENWDIIGSCNYIGLFDNCSKPPSEARILKDLSMMYRALWDRRHEGATRISQKHEARSAECIYVSEWPLIDSDLTMHDTSFLNPIITWIIWL